MAKNKNAPLTSGAAEIRNINMAAAQKTRKGSEPTVEDNKPRVYLSGPVEDTPDEGAEWRDMVKEFSDDFDWVDPTIPFKGTTILPADRGGLDKGNMTDEDLIRMQLDMMAQCDAVLVGWRLECHTSGTPMEMVYAKNMGLPVVTHTQNILDTPKWTRGHSDYVGTDIKECLDYLKEQL